MRFNEKDFKEKLKNNSKIKPDFAYVKTRIENEIINSPKRRFLNTLKAFFKSTSFKVSFFTSATIAVIVAVILIALLPNNPGNITTLTPPIFTGLSLKEDEYVNQSDKSLITFEPKENLEEDENYMKVEDLIDTNLSLPKDDTYYVDVNTDIILEVNFYNPDKFEIISFEISTSISDEVMKFTNYMFLDGSDLNTIYVNAGAMPNEKVTFTIENIKYIDGTEIKICKKEGNDKVTCYPKYYVDPIVSKTNGTITSNNATFQYLIEDSSNALSGTKVYVSNGTKIIFEELASDLKNINVALNDLIPNRKYDLAIYSYINKKDGKERLFSKIYEEFFTTPNYFDSYEIIPSYNSIEINISGLNVDAIIKEINIYNEDGNFFKNYPINTKAEHIDITDLYSNHNYIAEIVASNSSNLIISKTTSTFSTLKYETPIIKIINLSAKDNFLNYDLEVYDPSLKGSVTATRLYENTTLVFYSNNLTNYYDQLSFNSFYTLVVEYTYNLNDGRGDVIITAQEEFSTKLSDISIENVDYTYFVNVNQDFNITITLDNPSNINIYQIEINDVYYPALKISPNDFSKYIVQLGTFTIPEIKEFNITRYSYYYDDVLISDTFVKVTKFEIKIYDKLTLTNIYSTQDGNYFMINDPNERIYLEINLPDGVEIYNLIVNTSKVFNYSYSNGILTIIPYDNYLQSIEDVGIGYTWSQYFFSNIERIYINYGKEETATQTVTIEVENYFVPLQCVCNVIKLSSLDQIANDKNISLDLNFICYTLLDFQNDITINNLDYNGFQKTFYSRSSVNDKNYGVIKGNNYSLNITNMFFVIQNTNSNAPRLIASNIIYDLNINFTNYNQLCEKNYHLIETIYASNLNVNFESFHYEEIKNTNGYTFTIFDLEDGYLENSSLSGVINLKNNLKGYLITDKKFVKISNLNYSLSYTYELTEKTVQGRSYAFGFFIVESNEFPSVIEDLYINGSYQFSDAEEFFFAFEHSKNSYKYHNIVINENNYFSSNFVSGINPDYEY